MEKLKKRTARISQNRARIVKGVTNLTRVNEPMFGEERQLTRSVRPFLNSEPSNRADIIFQSARHRQIRDRLISAARTMQARVQFHGAEGGR